MNKKALNEYVLDGLEWHSIITSITHIRRVLETVRNDEMRFHLRNALCAMEIVKDYYDNLPKQGE